MNSLKKQSRGSSTEFEFRQSDQNNVELAALMHDLGHSVNSHLFDLNVIPRLLGQEQAKDFTHEHFSELLVNRILTDIKLPDDF